MRVRSKYIIGLVINLISLLLLAILIIGLIYFFGNNLARQSILNWLDPSVHESDLGFMNRGAKLCGPLSTPQIQADSFVKDIYVDGNSTNVDARPEASIGSPENSYTTLGQALCAVQPGQIVHIRPGVYQESIFLEKVGEPASPQNNDSSESKPPIKIVADSGLDQEPTLGSDPKQLVILDGQNKLTYGLALIESQNIIVEGLTFKNYTDAGLLVAKSQAISIKQNIFVDNGRSSIEPDYDGEGFGLQVSDSKKVNIENNQVLGNGPNQDRRKKGDLGTGIDTFGNQDVLIAKNDVHDNFGGGILVEDSEKVKVESNKIYKNDLDASAFGWWDAGIWVDGGKQVSLYSNLIADNRGPAIELSDEEGAFKNDPPASLGFTVTGNQLRNNYYARFIFGYGTCPDPPKKVLEWHDNLEENNYTDQPLLPDHELSDQYLCLK